MMVLTIRADNPQAELGLYLDKRQLDYETWTAHRQLAETIHTKLQKLMSRNNVDFEHIKGLAVYKGPGSFTGLRISLSVANALAYSLDIPIVGTSGINWQEQGLLALANGENMQVVMPDYGSQANTTNQKK